MGIFKESIEDSFYCALRYQHFPFMIVTEIPKNFQEKY